MRVEPVPQVGRAGFGRHAFALLALEANQGAVDQMDHGMNVGQGHRDRYRLGLEPLPDGGEGLGEIRPRPIHLVDEEEGREVETGALSPHRFSLWFDRANAVQHQDTAVLHPHGALHLDGEVHMPWGVDHLDQVVPPGGFGDRRGDGDAVALLLGQVVHVGGAVVDLPDLVGGPGVEQDALGECGLARIHMGRDPDIADVRQSRRLFHF